MKKILIRYDGYIIHKIYIYQNQNKVIQVKNFHIFKNFKNKFSTNILNYKNKPIFERFLLANEKNSKNFSPITQKISSS